jgi:cytochrome c oxidase assembly protein subunit 11
MPADRWLIMWLIHHVFGRAQAALYFNKIQCFCFEEQMLHPNEKIDMPVFFFIDPDIMNDRTMDYVDTITLSYTFFKVGDADAPDIAGLLVPAHPPRAGAKAGMAQGSSNFMQ